MPLKIIKTSIYLALAYFSYLMVLITLQYIPVKYDAAFLNLKESEITQTHYRIAFFSHVYTSILVLALGITQFSTNLRQKYAKLHMYSGRLYTILILVLAAPSGMVMAYYANGGFWSQLSFMLQAFLWITFTTIGIYQIKKRNFLAHRNFMIRSYALTLSAISLRLFKWSIVNLLEWPPMDTYRLVSWLGWVVNLIIAELLIAFVLNRQKTKPTLSS